MDKIFCQINLFDKSQTIYLVKSEDDIKPIAEISVEEIADFVYKYCYNNNIYNVTFKGDVEYINEIIKIPIKQKEAEVYSNNKIEIEVIN